MQVEVRLVRGSRSCAALSTIELRSPRTHHNNHSHQPDERTWSHFFYSQFQEFASPPPPGRTSHGTTFTMQSLSSDLSHQCVCRLHAALLSTCCYQGRLVTALSWPGWTTNVVRSRRHEAVGPVHIGARPRLSICAPEAMPCATRFVQCREPRGAMPTIDRAVMDRRIARPQEPSL